VDVTKTELSLVENYSVEDRVLGVAARKDPPCFCPHLLAEWLNRQSRLHFRDRPSEYSPDALKNSVKSPEVFKGLFWIRSRFFYLNPSWAHTVIIQRLRSTSFFLRQELLEGLRRFLAIIPFHRITQVFARTTSMNDLIQGVPICLGIWLGDGP
jgi:hypothetical protein